MSCTVRQPDSYTSILIVYSQIILDICTSLKIAATYFRRTMHHVHKRNVIQYIAMILPTQRVTTLNDMQVIIMQTLWRVGEMQKLTYYAGIMRDAFLYLRIMLKIMLA